MSWFDGLTSATQPRVARDKSEARLAGPQTGSVAAWLAENSHFRVKISLKSGNDVRGTIKEMFEDGFLLGIVEIAQIDGNTVTWVPSDGRIIVYKRDIDYICVLPTDD